MITLNQGIVLVPVDFAHASLEAVRQARAMVDTPADVHVVTVLTTQGDPAVEEALSNHAQRESQMRGELVRQVGGDVTHHIRFGDAGSEICALAADLDANLIVIPSHGQGASSLPIGSTAERVARVATCPVFLIRKG